MRCGFCCYRDWKMTFLKFLLLIVGLFFFLTATFFRKMESICWEIFKKLPFLEFPWVQSVLGNLYTLILLFLLHTILELPKVIFLHKNHWKEFMLQVIVFLGLPLSLIFVEETNSIITALFTLLLLLNFLESLSSNMFCGKYILLSWGVLKTLFNSIFPIVVLIFAMAATDFTLRQEEMTRTHFKAIHSSKSFASIPNYFEKISLVAIFLS